MSDAHLVASFAGDAAQVEDTLGLPSYAQFKKYAIFRTELTDFGVDLRQLTRLLAECDYGLAVGGMGLGDLNILFNTMSKRMSALTFDGVLRLCRLLRPRLAKLEAMMEATDPEQRDPTTFRPQSASGSGPGLWASARGLLPLAASIRSRGLNRVGSVPHVDFAAGMAEEEGGAGAGGGGGGGTATQASGSTAGAARGVSFRQAVQIKVSEREGIAVPPGSTGQTRPGSASRLGLVGSGDMGLAGVGSSGAASGAAGGSGSGSGSGPSTSGRGAAPAGLASLMALKDPPVLLREHLPPPPCSFPAIAARISGIMVLYRDGEMTRVALALRDLQRDWEDAVSAAAIKAAIRRQSQAGPAAPVETSEAELRGQIPLEGRIWLLLLHGCGLVMEGKHRAARKSLQAAESLFDPTVLGMEHPYHSCTHMFFGFLSYYEQQYDDALEKFECARELADMVSRGSLNVTARRNVVACLNNKGVCHSLLGNRSDAVVAFRGAHELLRSMTGMPELPEALVAHRNLNKALKQGFALNTSRLRPTSAPAMYAHVGSTTIPPDQKLRTFLRSVITTSAPSPLATVPAWCTKVTADDIIARKKAKEAEKKAKAKAAEKAKSGGDKGKAGPKLKKTPPFDAMTTYPFASYGLANVKLAVKRGRKKKAAAP